MRDLVDRQAAIDAVNKLAKWYYETYHETRPTAVAVIDALMGLPSAQRKGKWIYLNGLDAFECSVCGMQMVRNIFDYCPWCGAEMTKGEEDE